MHDGNYSRALSVITREQYSFVSYEPNKRVKRKIPQGTNHYSRFFVNLDVSCTVAIAQYIKHVRNGAQENT